MSTSLPQEITDLIIDHLHSSIPTLKKCSLISHSWLPRTRSHLFQHLTIDLRHKSSLYSFVEQFHLYVGSNPGVARYVGGLEITLCYLDADVLVRVRKELDGEEGSAVAEMEVEAPQELPPRMSFTNLRFLRMNFACQHLTRDAPWRIARVVDILMNNPLLEHLTLQTLRMDAESLRVIVGVLGEYTMRLKVLVLDDILEFDEGRKELELVKANQISLEGFFVSQAKRTQGVMSAVFRSPVFDWSGLKKLALIGGFNEEDVRALVDSGCGESVTWLTLDIRSLRSDDLRVLVFANFPHVTHLQLIASPCENNQVLLALDQITKSMHKLQDLRLSNAMLCEEMDECLARVCSSSTSLKNVRISFGNWFARPSLLDVEKVKKKLSRTSTETTVNIRSEAISVWWHEWPLLYT